MRRPALCTSVLVLVVALALAAGAGYAQQSNQPAPPSAEQAPPTAEQADQYFQAQEWQKAADAYAAMVAREPENSPAWFRLGVARHSLQDYRGAIQAYEQADKLGFPLLALSVRTAAAYAHLGQKDQAFAWLEKALQQGAGVGLLKNIPAFAPLHDDARWQPLLDRYAHPCDRPGYRAFDFWVGEWEVTSGGQTAGTNRIEKLLDGCALLENWTGAGGGSGKSLNYYNDATGKWRQVWDDESGRIIEYEGEFRDGVMRFLGTGYRGDGKQVLQRMTFTPLNDHQVRQLLEQSGDGGKTWAVWFDGLYTRKADTAP